MKPRINVVPEYEYTMGEHAIKLCSLAGLNLDDWQQDAVNAMLGVGRDDKWACFEYAEIVPRQNGKGAILEARALAGLFLLDEKLIMWSAHEHKTANEGFIRMREHVLALERVGAIAPGSVRIVGGKGEQVFELKDTGQRIIFIARSRSSGRGFSGNVNIIDEAYDYTGQQHSALLPTVSAKRSEGFGGQFIYTSTPPLKGEESEILYRLRNRVKKGDVEELGYRDWGEDGNLDDLVHINVHDRDGWRRANPGWAVRIDEKSIAKESRSMSKLDFARERLGIWPKEIAGENGVIDMDQWHSLIDASSTRNENRGCAIGVDISPNTDSASIGIYAMGTNNLGHAKLINHAPGTNWIIDRMKQLKEKVDPFAWVMGKATFESLKVDLKDAGFEEPEKADEFRHGNVLVLGGILMAAACGHMIEAVRDSTMRVRPDVESPEVLESAVASAQLREGVDTVVWSRKGKANITPLFALTCARYGYVSLVDNIHEDDNNFFGAWR